MIKFDEFIVLSPRRGAVDSDHLRCWDELKALGAQVFVLTGCPLIDHARSFLASKALDMLPDCKVFVWIDDDILFDPQDVLKLADKCLTTHALVGASYSSRSPGGLLVGAFQPSVKEVTFFEGGGDYPADSLGFGFTAVRREVFELVGRSLPILVITGAHHYQGKPYFANMWRDGKMYGEDLSFCFRAVDMGFSIWLDTTIRVFHKGHYRYGIEDVVQKVGRPNAPKLTIQHDLPPPTEDTPE